MFPLVDLLQLYLVLIGFSVGVIGGFLGFGGGFMVTPALFAFGMPMNIAVGTAQLYVVGQSIVATIRHGKLGNVDLKLGVLMTAGTIAGVETGARLIEFFEKLGEVDVVVGATYIGVLSVISAYMVTEGYRAGKRSGEIPSRRREVLTGLGIAEKVQGVRLSPLVSLPVSRIKSISVWVVLFIGYATGILAGFIGAGGGFVRVPALLYLIGCPTTVAVGTDLFEVVISGGYGSLTHAIKGNVDISTAIIMLTGAAIGAQIGSIGTKYFEGPNIRFIFGACVGFAVLSTLCRLLGELSALPLLTALSQVIILGAAGTLCVVIVGGTIVAVRKARKSFGIE